jgi:hypothetical protein
MNDRERQLLLHGRTDRLPVRIPLRAGPLSLVLEAGDVRYVSLGGREIVRRIYGAVRDREWGTVPAALSDVTISTDYDRFRVSYRSEHRDGPIDFVWRGLIEGGSDGTVTFAFSGEARSTFERNRIGLCVLHPMRECAGRPATAHLTNGANRAVTFPDLVAIEQPIDGFTDLAGLTYDVGTGLVELAFAGDAFETEDQRNWIDASFKTYSTPLSRPAPVVVARGTRIEQQVTLRLRTSAPRMVAMPTGVASEAVSAGERKLPRFGVGLGSPQSALDEARVELLSQLDLAHVRVDLSLADGAWKDWLARAVAAQRRLHCAVEIALYVGPESGPDLETLATLLPRDLPVARLLVFGRERLTTTVGALELLRTHLIRARPELQPVGAGSRGDLYELHRYPPPAADLICWSMNPHAHASDLTSLTETPPAAAAQVHSVSTRHPSVPTAITPVTIRPRVRGSTPRLHGDHPLQRSLFAAAWTLAVAAHLARAGANSVTFFDGLDDLTSGGDVFPVVHIVADVCEGVDGIVVPTERAADAAPGDGNRHNADLEALLLIRRRSDAVLLLANLSPHPRAIRIPPAFVATAIRVLDQHSARRAMTDWSGFRRDRSPARGLSTIELGAFATARVDGELTDAQ